MRIFGTLSGNVGSFKADVLPFKEKNKDKLLSAYVLKSQFNIRKAKKNF